MTQPLDRSCSLPALGDIDEDTGEFWAAEAFSLPRNRQNLSCYERNQAFLSVGGKSFLNFSHASGCDIDSDSRSVVAADFDRDGRQDLLVGSVGGGPLRLFRNAFPSEANRLRIDLVGTESNRRAIGARVIAHCGSRQIVRDLFPANAFMAQAPPEILLGTGDAETIDRLVVRWPSGKRQEWQSIPASGTLTITEGQKEATLRGTW